MTPEEKAEKNRDRMRKYYAANPEKVREQQRKYDEANSEKERERRIKRKYGLTMAQYDSMVEAQNEVCAICHKPETTIDKRSGIVQRLSVDHDHSTGATRGLLCFACNTSIGKFNDSSKTLLKAAEYLKKYDK